MTMNEMRDEVRRMIANGERLHGIALEIAIEIALEEIENEEDN